MKSIFSGRGDNAVDQRFSYAEWMKGDVKKASMLFDHRIDKEENKNRVNEKNIRVKLNHSLLLSK